jgi:UDP-glucose 4-epimerase
MPLNILVTGGAGYIGSHACKALAAGGYLPIAYDNLSRGHRQTLQVLPRCFNRCSASGLFP